MELLRDFRDVLLVLNTLALIVIGLTTWLRKPGADALAALAKHASEASLTDQEHRNRLTTLEERMRHMPTSDELSELEGSVKAIDVRTEGQSEAIATIRATLGRIETYLLSRK